MKLTAFITIVLLALSSGLAAQDLEQVTGKLARLLGDPLQVSVPVNGRFHEFQVSMTDSVVADTARYTLAFRISPTTLYAMGLGGFIFSFPDGFDLSRAEVGAIADNHPELDFSIRDTYITSTTISIGINRSLIVGVPINADSTITFTLVVADVINPTAAGTHHLAGLAFDADGIVLAGPAVSSGFLLLPRPAQTLVVLPGEDTTLAAGEVLGFEAVGQDEFGNEITGLTTVWSLTESLDSIGELSGAALLATRTGMGQVKAVAEGLAAFSGAITVLPGPVATIALDLPLQQLINRPLFGPGTATLVDAYGNRRTNHNLTQEPLTVHGPGGMLAPTTINDNAFLAEGRVNLTAAGLAHVGPTAQEPISVSIGSVFSSGEVVSFSGYEVIAVLGRDYEPLTTLPAGAFSLVRLVVVNRGLLPPSRPVRFSVTTGDGGEIGYTVLVGGSNGRTDTLQVTAFVPPGTVNGNTLRVKSEAWFTVGGEEYRTESIAERAVVITDSPLFSLVPGSFGPEALYPGAPFKLSFDLGIENFDGPVDSTRLRVVIGNDAAVVINRKVNPTAITGGVLSYREIAALMPESPVVPAGVFDWQLQYTLYSEDHVYRTTIPVGTVTILAPVALSYVPGTLAPPVASAGYQAAFEFSLNLAVDYAVELNPEASSITAEGNGFAATTSLRSEVQALDAGENHIQTNEIFVPENQLGEFLAMAGRFVVSIPLAGAVDTVHTSFAGEEVEVRDLPVTQIVSLEILSPNAPNVNTSQPFQLRATVANLSGVEVGPLVMSLLSDGGSQYDTLQVIASIAPYDTGSVLFNCVAAAQPDAGEIFRVRLAGSQINTVVQQPPLDNIALLYVQRPAQLALTYSLFGTSNGVVDYNTPFGLTVEVENLGDAATSLGQYRLTTGGVEFGMPDTLIDSIRVGRHLEFTFVSPPFDTSVSFVFELTARPDDLNADAPAALDRETFSFVVHVQTQEADLLVAVTPLGSNLVSANSRKELFRFDLTNRGVTTVTAIRLQNMRFNVFDRNGGAISAAALFDPDQTDVLSNGMEVPTVIVIDERLTVHFENLIIPSGQTRTLSLRVGFSSAMADAFTVSLETEDIDAVFYGGPQDGRQVRIESPYGRYVVSRTYAVQGEGLEESFVIQNNPFNPLEQPAVFSYELIEPSRVEFRVYTLTGEEVYSEDIPVSAGGIGEQPLEWDGRNNDGGMVSNGVYVACIRVVRTGAQAKIKVAVVK